MSDIITDTNATLLETLSRKRTPAADPVESDVPIGLPPAQAAAPETQADAEPSAPGDETARRAAEESEDIVRKKRVLVMGMREVDARLRTLLSEADIHEIPQNDIVDMRKTGDAAMDRANTLIHEDLETVRREAEKFRDYVENIEAYIDEQAAARLAASKAVVSGPEAGGASVVVTGLSDPIPVSEARNSGAVDASHREFEAAVGTLSSQVYSRLPNSLDSAKKESAEDQQQPGDPFGALFGSILPAASAAVSAAAAKAWSGYVAGRPEIHMNRAKSFADALSANVLKARNGSLGKIVEQVRTRAASENMDMESYRRRLHAQAASENRDVEALLPSFDSAARREADALRVSIDRMMAETAKAAASAVKAGRPEDEIRAVSDWARAQRDQAEAILGDLPVNSRMDPAREYLKKKFERLMEAIQAVIERVAAFFGAVPSAAPKP